MPAEGSDFWRINPLICDFLEKRKCTHDESKTGKCNVVDCPFERY